MLVSSSTGSFSGSVTISASAVPGKHYITAIGRKSGDTAQSTFTVGSPWTQFGFSAAHSAANPWENTLSPSNVGTIGPKWINLGGSLGASGATVAVNFGTAYVSLEGNGVEALSTGTGSALWSFATAGTVYASPTLSGSAVYIGSASTNTVYALNATTGGKIWSSVLGGSIYDSAAVANGIVYVSCKDGYLYALNASTGATVWKYAAYPGATPTVVNGVVYTGSLGNKVFALNASTGAVIWASATTEPVYSTPAVVNGVVYVGSDDFVYQFTGNVYAFRAESPNAGKLLWEYPLGESQSSPAVANNMVYVADDFGNLDALNATTGNLDWVVTAPNVVRNAAVANGVLYYTTGDYFYAANAATGATLGAAATGAMYEGSPSISDGAVYVAAEGGGIYAFSLTPNLNNTAVGRAGPPLPASLHPDPLLRVTP